MKNSMISVKTKPGRIAFDGPRGEQIPNDKFKLVHNTTWIQRLINEHGDLEVESGKVEKPVAADASGSPATPPSVDGTKPKTSTK